MNRASNLCTSSFGEKSNLKSYKDPRLTEVTYHCINFNERVRKVPKIKIYIFGTFLKSLKLMQWYVTSVSRGSGKEVP
jgi:hypothetical protein